MIESLILDCRPRIFVLRQSLLKMHRKNGHIDTRRTPISAGSPQKMLQLQIALRALSRRPRERNGWIVAVRLERQAKTLVFRSPNHSRWRRSELNLHRSVAQGVCFVPMSVAAVSAPEVSPVAPTRASKPRPAVSTPAIAVPAATIAPAPPAAV